MSDLSNYAQKNTVFVKLEDGQTYQFKYLGFKIVPNQFDPSKEIVIYEVEQEGHKHFFKTASAKVARTLSKFEAGTMFNISRTGQGLQTRYEITPA